MLGRVIGQGGANLKELEEATSARVDIGNGGLIHIFAPSAAQYEAARLRLLESAGETIKVCAVCVCVCVCGGGG